MTARKQDPSDPDDLGDLRFMDAATRAESEWLLARERDPSAPAPSPEIASEYAEIEDLLRHLPLGPSEESWHDEVLRAAAATLPRPWWRSAAFKWMIGGGVVAVAAAALLVVVPPAHAELEVATRHVGATRGDPKEVVVGDQLTVIARPHGTADLRVYRSGGTLVAGCPHGPGCRTHEPGELAIEVILDAPVQYQVILVVGATGGLPDGTMESYLEAARAVHADITPHPIDVH